MKLSLHDKQRGKDTYSQLLFRCTTNARSQFDFKDTHAVSLCWVRAMHIMLLHTLLVNHLIHFYADFCYLFNSLHSKYSINNAM